VEAEIKRGLPRRSVARAVETERGGRAAEKARYLWFVDAVARWWLMVVLCVCVRAGEIRGLAGKFLTSQIRPATHKTLHLRQFSICFDFLANFSRADHREPEISSINLTFHLGRGRECLWASPGDIDSSGA